MTKSNFDKIYTEPDPRAYYETLGGLGYEIPAHSATLFGQVASIVGNGHPAKVVDLCCSYGVNSAMLKYDVGFDEVLSHYIDPACRDLGREELLCRDRGWLAERASVDAPVVVGVDASAPAIDYACEAGLLDGGMAEDLEVAEPSDALTAELADVDLISVSGGIGYITERTIDRVLDRAESPWVAALCLRWVDFGPIVDAAARHGLVTERLDDTTFPQRRFADDAERDHVLAELEEMGIEPDGREAEGWHHTDFYLLRPAEDVDAAPLAELVVPEGGVRSPDADRLLEATVASSASDLRACTSRLTTT
ncbi:MAG: hypothetical protein WD232_04945 [Acidimicrobiales bacterium]